MPHFKTWDDTYWDYSRNVDIQSINIGIGELEPDATRRIANYRFSADQVPFTP